ncbi:MAG: hypothetical protein RBT01_04490 [Anaerolineaceae bacterium]|jgi:hypothetical protein|nr:hypothetical protein [Anaerolineaceae bacterium]
MKTVLKVLLLFAIVLTVSSMALPFTSAQTLPPPESIREGEYLLMLPMPDLKGIDIPPLRSRSEVERYAASLLVKQAAPLINELQALKDRGQVGDFELLPEQQSVLIHGNYTDSQAQFSQLSGVEALTAVKEENTCGIDRFAALQEQIYSISHTQDFLEGYERKPSQTEIIIPYRDGFYGSVILGYTIPSVEVTLRVIRDGVPLGVEQTMTSTSDGEFIFFPDYLNCLGYNWILQAGDVVEITAAGKTTSTTVVNLNFWVDPISNQVTGITAPGKSIEINLDVPQANFCSRKEYVKNTLSDEAGNFNIDFSDQVDFNNASSAIIIVSGDNGHSIINFQSSYGINVGIDSGYINLTLKPDTDYTVNIKRSDVVITSYSRTTGFDGNDEFYSSETLQAGDVITVQGGGRTLTYTVATFSDYYVDVNSHQLTAKTDPGRKISASFNHRDYAWGYLQNGCSSSLNCASATADNSGAFTLNSSLVLLRGDYVDLSIYDQDGNSQNHWNITSSAIIAGAGKSFLVGFWGSPDRDLTIIIKNSSNEEKGNYNLEFWNSVSFQINFSPMILEVGDIITVTDGIHTETMSVPDLHVELNKDTDQLTVDAPSGNAVIYYWDDNPREDTSTEICSEWQIINDGIAIPYDDVSSQDYALITFRGADGHYTYQRVHAASLNASYEGHIYGYTMTPNQNMEVNLLDGSTVLETKTSISSSFGNYEFDFDTDLIAGYRIQVKADTTEEMIVPTITINRDTGENRLYGNSPPDQPLFLRLRNRSLYSSDYIAKSVTADASGNYSVPFAGDLFDNCELADVGGQCVDVNFEYYDVNEFEYYGVEYLSTNVEPDVWEDNNSFDSAKMYSGYQQHTFHEGDTQDWIKLTVNPADVGKPYYLMTTNLGRTMDTVLHLYDRDGVTELASDNNSGGLYASQIYWIPDKSGTYYILVEPRYPKDVDNCGASYDFVIVRSKTWLPLIAR